MGAAAARAAGRSRAVADFLHGRDDVVRDGDCVLLEVGRVRHRDVRTRHLRGQWCGSEGARGGSGAGAVRGCAGLCGAVRGCAGLCGGREGRKGQQEVAVGGRGRSEGRQGEGRQEAASRGSAAGVRRE